MIHLDTNLLIQALRRESPAASRMDEWLAADQELAISALAWGEFLCGPLGSEDEPNARIICGTILELSPADAEMGAALFNATGEGSTHWPTVSLLPRRCAHRRDWPQPTITTFCPSFRMAFC